MRYANNESYDPLTMLGRLIAEFMDAETSPLVTDRSSGEAPRQRIIAALAREGLSYTRGGYIHGASLSGPSRSLAERVKSEGIHAIEIEYERAYKSIEGDPGAAVTAACAILESVCKYYLEEQGIPLPKKQVLGTVWSEVANHLGLSPKDVADDDLKRILQGLYSIGDGVAALRTLRVQLTATLTAEAIGSLPGTRGWRSMPRTRWRCLSWRHGTLSAIDCAGSFTIQDR